MDHGSGGEKARGVSGDGKGLNKRRFGLRLPGRKCEPITLWDNPVLRTVTTPVTSFDRDLGRLVDQLFETMYAIKTGVGLAATQIGRTQQVFVFDCQDGVVGHVVNPVIEPIGSQVQVGWEGCLSLPGMSAETSRLERCRVRGQDADGNDISYEGEGLRARCFQHETDHLNGMLYIDHQSDDAKAAIEARMRTRDWYGHLSLDPYTNLYKRSQAEDDEYDESSDDDNEGSDSDD